jgi:hypothetical protein
VLVLGGAADAGGTLVERVRVHVALTSTLALLPASTDATGSCRLVLPLPAMSRGVRVFVQLVWLNTASCRGNGPLSATDALDVTVQ